MIYRQSMMDTMSFGWILVFLAFTTQAQYCHAIKAVVTSGILSVLPCPGLRTDVSIQHPDIFACSATWKGHIERAGASCNNGWHICTWNDTDVLERISWYEATHISGCYVINAAHNGSSCGSCQEKKLEGEMAAIGADCITIDSESNSCFGRGRIDASLRSVPQYTPCHYAPWISGVLCCKDKIKGQKPVISVSPKPYTAVPSGSTVEFKCRAEGDPAPKYQWSRNGVQISTRYSPQDVGVLRFSSVSPDDAGFYQCIASNSHGSATSYKFQLRVTEPTMEDIAAGCRDPTRGKLIGSADIAVCDGAWQGHVGRASKHMCARGWRVCSMKDRRILQLASWADVSSHLPGCYAYNAATSKFFPCSKCTPRRKGNRMSGIGEGCGRIEKNGRSCLRRGRIDATSPFQPKRNATNSRRARKQLHSCRFTEGVTTGVVCCKATKRHRKARCAKECKENSHCNSRGKCVCQRGYRRVRGNCEKKPSVDGGRAPLVTSCWPGKCMNGGVCKNGKCDCKTISSGYHGLRCEIKY